MKFRLFDIDEQGLTKQQVPRFLTNRMKDYEQILKRPIPRQVKTTPFASQGKFEYARTIRGGSIQTFHGSIPEAIEVKEKHLLPSYREKKKLSLELPFNGLSLGKEMDEMTGKSSAWENRAASVVLESIDWDSEFVYKARYAYGFKRMDFK